MGKYGGKVLTVYVTPSGVRVAEGENKNGSPFIARFFKVGGVEEFFTEQPGAPGVFEITNMSGLVEAIVNECHNQHTTSRRVMVCSNCFGIDTTVNSADAKGSLKDKFTGDIGKGKKDKAKKQSSTPGKMYCRVPWGDLVEDGKVVRKITESVGDKFTLKSLVQEFYKRGYDVISISDNIGVLVNFRQTVEATFDSQGKIIFDFDTSYHVMSLNKDIPVAIDGYAPMDNDEILERITNLLTSCAESVGRNPKVYLTGAGMGDTMLYSALIDHLESEGYIVYDLFDRPTVNPETGLAPDTDLPVLTPDYSANIAMFMAAYAKNVISIVPAIEFSEIFKKNSKAVATVMLGMSAVLFLVTGIFAGIRFFKMQDIASNPPKVDSLNSQISSLNANKQVLQSTIDTLSQADVTVLDLMDFAVANQSDQIRLLSIDTLDMLPASVSVDGNQTTVAKSDTAADTGDEVVSGSSGSALSNREAIIIRGYAKTGAEAVAYYDRLFHKGLVTDPVLNGIEKYALPNDEEVYIFEIRVGGAS